MIQINIDLNNLNRTYRYKLDDYYGRSYGEN